MTQPRTVGGTDRSKGQTTQKRQVPIVEGYMHLPTAPTEEAYLIGSKCRACGYVCFPKRWVCPICVQEGTMEDIPLSRRGKVYSFTTAWVAPPGYQTPYVQAWVNLPEGARVFTIIGGREASATEIEVGTDVELVVEKVGEDREGNDVMGYKFRPVS